MERAGFGFAAGFLATLIFHQPVLWLLHAGGLIPRAPCNMKPARSR